MSNVSYDLLIKNFVSIYIEMGDVAAGAYAVKNFPPNWRKDAHEWQSKIQKEFASRGFELAVPEPEND